MRAGGLAVLLTVGFGGSAQAADLGLTDPVAAAVSEVETVAAPVTQPSATPPATTDSAVSEVTAPVDTVANVAEPVTNTVARGSRCRYVGS